MDKITFRKEEVISYIEDLINVGAANEEQEELYMDYIWNGKLDKTNYTYKKLIVEMRKLHEVKF